MMSSQYRRDALGHIHKLKAIVREMSATRTDLPHSELLFLLSFDFVGTPSVFVKVHA